MACGAWPRIPCQDELLEKVEYMSEKKYQKEHETLLPVVRDAGAAVMKYFTAKNYEVKHKDPENPVTDADFAANTILRNALEKYFPDDAILSEESDSDDQRGQMERDRFLKKRVWIIDPIDGTREFIKGRDQFAVSLGLVENQKAVLGFIFNPARDYLVSGGLSLGLFKDGLAYQPVGSRKFNPPESYPKIVASRTEYFAGDLKHLEPFYKDLTEHSIGSIAYKLALVADGTYDLAVSTRPKNEWDIAGGAALLAASGLELYEGNFMPVIFNKPQTESRGLIAGTREACDWYAKIAKT